MQFKSLVQQLPQFSELLQEKQNNKLTHAYMFVSADELLLKEFSRIFAALVMCDDKNAPCFECVHCKKVDLSSHPDVTVLPSSEKVLVEDVEKLIDESVLVPMESTHKVYIFDKFSTANMQSQNKLLKTLETPPNNVYIILNVTNETNILPTIASRCKKIRLSSLSQQTLTQAVEPICKDSEKAKTIGFISEGSLTRAVNFADNENFMQNYNLVCEVISNLKNSSTVLPLSAKLNERKSYFLEILEIFESLFRDLLMIRLDRENLVTNKNILNMLTKLAPEYSGDAIDLIIKKLYLIKQELNFNVNPTTLIDNLLLYILEVKHLCK